MRKETESKHSPLRRNSGPLSAFLQRGSFFTAWQVKQERVNTTAEAELRGFENGFDLWVRDCIPKTRIIFHDLTRETNRGECRLRLRRNVHLIRSAVHLLALGNLLQTESVCTSESYAPFGLGLPVSGIATLVGMQLFDRK